METLTYSCNEEEIKIEENKQNNGEVVGKQPSLPNDFDDF